MTDISDTEIDRFRAETPACADLIHFNNAGAALSPRPAFEAVTAHLAREQAIGGYEAAAEAAEELKAMYASLARLLRVGESEIAFVENATRAWDMAFYALPLAEGDRILTHASEYASNYLAFLHLARRRGVEIDIAPSDASGQIDIGALPVAIKPRTRLIAITHVPTQGGLVNPAVEVGRIARAHGLVYLLDACQSVGQLDVDVSEIGCHILSGTGRKFLRGPRGTGFLYVSGEMIDRMDPPFIDLHAATWTDEDRFELAPGARRFENWESFVAGRLGLGAAVDYALAIGMARIETRVTALAAMLRNELREQGAAVHDLGVRRSGIVTFSLKGVEATALVSALRRERCNISVAWPSSARLDLGRRGLPPICRASVHYYNTEDGIRRFCALVGKAA